MKPPVFEYRVAGSLDEALHALGEIGDEGKALAGGQSLVPLLNFRLASPEVLVDLNRVGELAFLRRADGALRVGALCRQSRMEVSPVVRAGWPLLTEALQFVAHPQIRNRGTVGGSVAHADPAAELPVALTCLDARFHVRSAARGERTLSAEELFVTHLTTALEPDEVLVEIVVPPLPEGTGWGFCEYSRRHGDFALGGAAVLLEPGGGNGRTARITLLAAGEVPIRATEAERALAGAVLDEQTAREAAAMAVTEISPTGDIHGSSAYRRRLIEAMVRRALLRAAERTGNGAGHARA